MSVRVGSRRIAVAAALALLAGVAAVVALHIALAFLDALPEGRTQFGDESRYWTDARAIAAGEPWRPQPVWPVLYPALLAAIVRLGGGATAVIAMQSLLLFAAAMLWGDVTRRLTGSALAGAVAGSLLALDPQVAAFTHYFWPELVHLALFVAAVWLLVRWPERPGRLFVAGALLGLALLTKKLLWPFVPVLFLPAIAGASAGRERLRRAAALAAGLALPLAPAVAIFGPYAISPVSSAVFNLWVGLNDTGRTSFESSIVARELESYEGAAAEAAERDRLALGQVERRLGERGWAAQLAAQLGRQYFRLFDRDSFFTDQLPGGDVHAGGAGYRRAPPRLSAALRFAAYAIYLAVLWLAVGGALVFPPRGRAWPRVLLAFLAFNALVFLFLHVKSRYRIQFLPVLYLYAGAAIAWLAERRGGRLPESSGFRRDVGWRPALAATLVALCLSVWYFGI